MVSYDKRQTLKNKLPISVKNGFDLISEKLPDLTRKQIERAFNSEKEKDYREDVIAAALEVIEEFKGRTERLSNLIDKI